MQPFVVHAHFYQPERTNPWTGALDPEPSASPDRDWNERIHRECYRPNAVARIFDERRRVERLVNNYERLSFNFGPTLLGWLERHHPGTYAKVIDGDWRSTVRTGHGNALAQAYHHTILPLANERDRGTQIRWGLADFRHRFNRDAEGMWLPETAVDQATVDALIDAGVRYTVLAPHQARTLDGDEVDPTRAYRCLHADASGRWLAVFFYDGPLAQALAFDTDTGNAKVLIDRLRAAGRDGDGLVSAAVDGETFGHHRRFGELGLAYTLFEGAARHGLEPTNFGAYLAAHPPLDEARVLPEGSSWSCAHGIGRWMRDCGCATGGLPGWSQAWRAPLRAALDLVRDAAVTAMEGRGAELLRDPWAARDAYIEVRLGMQSPAEFLQRYGRRSLSDEQQVDLWTLLEAHRHAMTMYTSCGWFFADISGIESVYVLRSAARAIDLLTELGVEVPYADVLETLGEARSNVAGAGTGADLWRTEVEPAAVTRERLAAHIALLASVRTQPEVQETAGHRVRLTDQRSEARGRVALTTAHIDVESLTTGRSEDFSVAVVHLGGLDFSGVVAPFTTQDAFAKAVERLWVAFPTAPMARLLRLLDELFDGRELSLDDALPEGRQEIVGDVFGDLTDRFHEQYSRLYHDHRRVLEMLTAAGYELPRDLRAAGELTLATQLERQLAEAHAAGIPPAPASFEALRATVAHARAQGYQLDLASVEEALTAAVTAATRTAATTLDPADVARVDAWLALSAELGLDVDLSGAQEHAYAVACKARAGRLSQREAAVVAELGERVGLAPVAWSAP